METILNIKKQVELFHLLFIEQLSQKLDKRLYAIKGGCNLRFFLGSIRYSEDLDIDVQTVAPDTLKKLINKILSGISFKHRLQIQGISLLDFSTPKQTATTQRWKIQLQIENHSLPINTKIECSRRNTQLEISTDPPSRELLSAHQIRPFFMSHYAPQLALDQKIQALISRTETQARDIFDIYHLINTYPVNVTDHFSSEELNTALTHAHHITFPDFKSQVVSYLEPHHQTEYDDIQHWENILRALDDFLRNKS